MVQIGKDIRMFTRALDFACVCAYGGSAVGDQISALKRGAEVSAPLSVSKLLTWDTALRLRYLPSAVTGHGQEEPFRCPENPVPGYLHLKHDF